jgi:manganese transport protein
MNKQLSRWLMTLGPGIITAAMVFGPSKITITSMMGARYGYDLLWIILVAIGFMIVFTQMAARVGLATPDSLLTTIGEKFGKAARIAIGIGVFLVCISFQAGNAIGTGISISEATGTRPAIWIILFNLIGIAMLFLRSFYKAFEKLMMALIGIMLGAFFITLFFTKPSLGGMVQGIIPSIPDGSQTLLIAFMASCFSIVGALYQAYMVQEKRKSRPDLEQRPKDTLPGMIILGGLSAIVLICSAAVLHARGIPVNTAMDMARALEPLFGQYATAIFLTGLFGASFSSLIGNAALGGTLLGDGLGYKGQLNSTAVKIYIGIIMVVGAAIAIIFGKLPMELITLAQAVTIFVVPFIGYALYSIANDAPIMGSYVNTRFQKTVALVGLVVMFGLAVSNAKNLFFS